jgi:putative flippase GtrA
MADSRPRRFLAAINTQERSRLIRFALVGASNGIVTFGLYAAMIRLGASYQPAAILGYAAGIMNGYTWNRTWTFRSGAFHLPEFCRYLLVQVGGLAANLIGLAVAVESLGMGKILAEVLSLVPIILVTFLLNRWWTFRPRSEAA